MVWALAAPAEAARHRAIARMEAVVFIGVFLSIQSRVFGNPNPATLMPTSIRARIYTSITTGFRHEEPFSRVKLL
jgi:hypothetical protein